MATKVRPYRNVRIEHFPVKLNSGAVHSDAAFSEGQLVTLESGYLILSTDNEEGDIVGVAAEDASLPAPHPVVKNSAGNIMKPVFVADEEGEFVMPFDSDDTPTVADVGVSYGVDKESDGSFTVDQDDTSTPVVKVVKVLEPGVAGGKVVVKFVSATRTPFTS